MAVQPGEIVLSFPSHRLRDRSGIARDPQATRSRRSRESCRRTGAIAVMTLLP